MLSRIVLAAAAAAGAAGLTTLGVFGVVDPHLALDPIQGPPGTTVTATGSGFCVSCGPVEIDFVTRPVKQGIVVAADGSFKTTFIVPGGAQAGTDAVNAYQQGTLVTQTSFNVTPSAPAPTPTATPIHSPTPVSPTPRVSPSPGSSPSPTPQATASPSSGGGPNSASSNAGKSGSGVPPAVIAFVALAVALLGAAAALFVFRLRRTRPG